MTTIQNTDDLLGFLTAQMADGNKQWFGFTQQKVTGIKLVHEIAARHADKMSPAQIVEYVIRLNDEIYSKIIKTR